MNWTPEKIEILKRDYPNCINAKVLAKQLGTNADSIYNKAKKYGLRRNYACNHITSLHIVMDTISSNKPHYEPLTTIRDLTNYTMKDFCQDLKLMYQEGFLSSIQYDRYTSRI